MSPKAFVGSAVALLLLLALLVAYLAKTQWDWLSRIEVYEHVRIEGLLSRNAWYLKRAFEGEIETLAACFDAPGGRRAELAAQLGRGLADWRKSSRWADLLEEVYVISVSQGGSVRPGISVYPGGLALERFEPLVGGPGGSFIETLWTPDLEALGQELSRRLLGESATAAPASMVVLDVVAPVPAILLETRLLDDAGRLEPAWLALRLDRALLRRRFLPELREMIFAPPSHHDVDLAVVETASCSTRTCPLPPSRSSAGATSPSDWSTPAPTAPSCRWSARALFWGRKPCPTGTGRRPRRTTPGFAVSGPAATTPATGSSSSDEARSRWPTASPATAGAPGGSRLAPSPWCRWRRS